MNAPATSGAWRQGVLCQAMDPKTVGLREVWHLATRMSRLAVCTVFSPSDA
ncbi:hypothetical protein DEO72_LG1g3001 [Vigna unguiculata]|uniref:Uncharacterized protein n=1 Tax=Vigna unguiculata TaxID=3917 RepID=A0A4D6KP79_VIGUN|nr:hypothetical protein DEO72_LG1g3001 [Vigna unguiculata]